MKAINCQLDQAKFDALNSKAISFLKEVDTNLNSDVWCNPVIHPTSGDIAFTIKDRILPALTASEQAEIVVLTEDWFPILEL